MDKRQAHPRTNIEIRKKTGEKISVHFSELNRQTQDAMPKTVADDEIKYSLWRYESLEEIFKDALISHEGDFLPLLRKDDLITPLIIPKEQLENIRRTRTDKILKNAQLSLPVGYIVTSVPCKYKIIDANTTAGSCASPEKALAYAKPDRNSEKVLEASLLWAHLEGRPIQSNKLNPAEKSEELLIFEEQGDWLRMKLVVLEKEKRFVWLNKKDIPYKIVRLIEVDRLKTLIEFLNPASGSQTDKNRSLADNLKFILDQPFDLGLDSTGETKWSNGILWVKVNVRSESQCSDEETKLLSTGWLPYIDSKTKKRVLGWHSRGC